jgi:Berberine and berberine like
MTKLTLQTFPAHDWASWRGSLHGRAGSTELWNGIVAVHSSWARHLAPAGCAGYITGSPDGTGRISVSVNLPGVRSKAELDSTMRLVEQEVHRAAGMGRINFTGIGTFHEAPLPSPNAPLRALDGPDVNSAKDKTFPGNGENKLITSWLYGSAELTSPRLRDALAASHDADSLMWQDMTGGPGVARPPYLRGGSNAVNPGWRSAVGRLATEINWAGTDVRKLAKRKGDLVRMGRSLQSLNPNMGTYVNEADPDMPEAQRAFWGSNYPQLLNIKKKWDPLGVFWCRSCVGSELWRETEGGLCKR